MLNKSAASNITAPTGFLDGGNPLAVVENQD